MQHLITRLELDGIDLKILAVLQTDASLTNHALAARVHVSPATCLRRVKQLVDRGVIERRVALLSPEALGHGLTAIVEVSLDRQSAEAIDAFEARAIAEAAVQQCHRVSPGPDFVLIVQVADMAGYDALVGRLFTQDANVRNVKAFFSVRRAKFETRDRPAAQRLISDQALQVAAFGKVHRHRVIGRRAEPGMDEGIDAGIDAGAGDDLVEQVGVDPARAREREQRAARREQRQREPVDVLVGARRALGVGDRRRELGRIEDDRVEAAGAASSSERRRLVDVGVDGARGARRRSRSARRCPRPAPAPAPTSRSPSPRAAPPASAATLKPPV